MDINIQDTLAIIAIIVFSLILLNYVVKGIGNLILGISNLSLKIHENNAAKRSKDIKLQGDLTNLSYVTPNQQGVLPVPRSSLDDDTYIEWMKTQYMSIFGRPKSVILPPSSIGDQHGSTMINGGVPDFFSLWQNDKLPKSGKILLGYNDATGEAVTSSFGEMYSSLVGGQPRSGKSTFVRFLIVQALLQGGKFVVIDPHADAGEDSLAGSFEAIGHKLYIPIAKNVQEQLNTIATVKQEIEDRIKGKKAADFDLIFITDETGQLLSDINTAKPMTELLNLIVNQAGKARVFALCIGQNWHSQTVSTVIRNSFISFFSTFSRKDVAKMMSGDVAFAEAADTLKVGQVVWGKRHENIILNVPNVTSRHVSLVVQMDGNIKKKPFIDGEYSIVPTTEYRKQEERYPLRDKEWIDEESSGKVVASSGFSRPLPTGLSAEKMAQIVEMIGDVKSATEIISTVWGVEKQGDGFQKAAKEYRIYLAEIAKGYKNK